MNSSIVFNGLNTLDFYDVRANVIRIPEVSARISEAQKIWDTLDESGFNFHNFLASDDSIFLNNIKLKSLAAAIVQVGLFDRYLRQNNKPRYLVGNSNGDSALNVAAGRSSFVDLVRKSRVFESSRPAAPLQIAEAPVLSGMSLTEFAIYEWGEVEQEEGSYQPVESEHVDINKVLQKMIDDHDVKQFVNIGPGNVLFSEAQQEFSLYDIQVLESIDLDPMLSWFWPSLRRQELHSLAQ